jgi:excisionase family DNA binding protein
MTLSDADDPNGADTLSTTEVQRVTGLSRHEVYALIQEGRLRRRQLAKGKHHRVYRSSVDELRRELGQSA